MSRLQKKLLELCAEQTNGVYCLSRDTFITYAEICDGSRRFGSVLGNKKQQVISVLLPNSIEYIEVMIFSFLTGNIFNPIPYFMSDKEVDRLLTIIGSDIVLTDRNLEVTPENKKKIVDVKKLSSTVPVIPYVDSDDESAIASLYYSSGTTGNQKGVLYSHENVFELITSICSEFKFGRATHHLSLLPFGHTASINYNILPCLFTRSNLTIAASFQMIMASFFQIVAAKKINYVQIVPSVLHMLMKIGEDVSKLDLSCLPLLDADLPSCQSHHKLSFRRGLALRWLIFMVFLKQDQATLMTRARTGGGRAVSVFHWRSMNADLGLIQSY